jgi:hypothetical protein
MYISSASNYSNEKEMGPVYHSDALPLVISSQEVYYRKMVGKYILFNDGEFRKEWKNKFGQLHREDGPAVICADGFIEYYWNERLHREDGPAIITPSGKYKYYLFGKQYPNKDQHRRAIRDMLYHSDKRYSNLEI